MPAKMLKQKLDKNILMKFIFSQMYHYHHHLPREKILGYSQSLTLRDSKISNILIKIFFFFTQLSIALEMQCCFTFDKSFLLLILVTKHIFFFQSQEAKWYFLVLLDVQVPRLNNFDPDMLAVEISSPSISGRQIPQFLPGRSERKGRKDTRPTAKGAGVMKGNWSVRFT